MANQALALLEDALRTRRLDRTLTTALAPLERTDAAAQAATDVAPLDARLGGGLPRGQLSEIVGPRSSGRTLLLLQTIAAATQRGEIAAVVDTLDRLDVASAIAAGVDLDRLLWIRGHDTSGPFGLKEDYSQQASERDLSAATTERPVVIWERHTTSRPQGSGPGPQGWARPEASDSPGPRGPSPGAFIERVLDRAVKALNLILQAGGFGVVALDLVDMPASAIARLPFTTWLRVQRTIEGSDTACVLLASQPLARSAGGLSLSLSARAEWAGDSDRSRRLAGMDVNVRVVSPRRRVEGEVGVAAAFTDHGIPRHRGTESISITKNLIPSVSQCLGASR